MIDALHTAYFDDGRDIGDRETLLAIAAENGFDATAMRAALSYPDFGKMVGDLADQVRQDGVQGVPFFVFNDAIALSGAYPPAQLVQAMAKAAEIAAERDAQSSQAETVADEPVKSGVE